MVEGVAPDGSPVAVYLALPAGEAPEIIRRAVPAGASILELGCGPGRLTRPLVALGHEVVAVDNSPDMLIHVTGADAVLGDVFDLDLGRAFDTVIAASNLINTPEADERAALLAVCRRHLDPDGVVLLERYEPGWAADPSPIRSKRGPVEISFEPLGKTDAVFEGRMTYQLGDQKWVQEFTGAHITDRDLADEAAAHDLHLEAWLDDQRTWAKLIPT